MTRKTSITVLVDYNTIPDDNSEFAGEPPWFNLTGEEQSTEYYVVNGLRVCGYRPRIFGVGDSVPALVEELTKNRPDMVFNLTELFNGKRTMDANIAALLEMLDIPYTGSSMGGLFISRNKGLCKQLLAARHIRVPAFFVCAPGENIRSRKELAGPMVVKPVLMDGSDGISNSSLVKNRVELTERIHFIHETFNQPAIAEEYIEGRELYLSILGNRRLRVLPPRELIFGETAGNGPVLATFRVKWNESYRKNWNIRFDFAELTDHELERVNRICRRVYSLLRIRDYGRIDIRMTREGKIYVLEANPNPGLSFRDEVAQSARRAGIPYPQLLQRIVNAALLRHRRQKSG